MWSKPWFSTTSVINTLLRLAARSVRVILATLRKDILYHNIYILYIYTCIYIYIYVSRSLSLSHSTPSFLQPEANLANKLGSRLVKSALKITNTKKYWIAWPRVLKIARKFRSWELSENPSVVIKTKDAVIAFNT